MESNKNLLTHPTGAKREDKESKGRFDCLPFPALERMAKQYELGVKSHGAWNWRKGIPQSSYISSAMRHLLKYNEGWQDEDHLAAVLFNIAGLMTLEYDVKHGRVSEDLLDHHKENNYPAVKEKRDPKYE